jgi:cytochrome c oxidase subunit 2
MTLLIFFCVIYFAIKYRQGSKADRTLHEGSHTALEVTWSVIPLVVVMAIFVWGASLAFEMMIAPDDTLSVYVVGRQWMWKLQHSEGNREINELHVPVGFPIKLTMISEDVIHSFYIPAFRIKQDVLPGRYVTTWFKATKPGTYHLFCAEYCGTEHSLMRGTVVAMEPAEYQKWLEGAGGTGPNQAVSRGEALFTRYRCVDCHAPNAKVRAPLLSGQWGRIVPLANGETTTFDEAYVRESILRPKAKVVAGYEPVMPSFEGQMSEQDILDLIHYLQSIGSASRTPEVP